MASEFRTRIQGLLLLRSGTSLKPLKSTWRLQRDFRVPNLESRWMISRNLHLEILTRREAYQLLFLMPFLCSPKLHFDFIVFYIGGTWGLLEVPFWGSG